MKIKCPYCKRRAEKPAGAVNRAYKIGAPVYCGRRCAGLARRRNKTEAQKKEEKRLYDLEYRARNLSAIKRKKAARHKQTYDPVKAAKERKKRAPQHVEYCRRPSYKAWKKEYDKKYRAKRIYGPFWEAAIAAGFLGEAIKEQCTRYEIYTQNGRLNKAQERRRAAAAHR